MACVYDRNNNNPTNNTEPKAASASSVKPSTILANPASTTDPADLTESRKRRLLELRLLHHYTAETSLTMMASTPSNLRFHTEAMPRLALENDTLLYSIFYLSALHMAKVRPQDHDAMAAYHQYLDMALRSHSIDLSNLSKSNADAVCLTSSINRIASFALLQERGMSSYTPPMSWLTMCNGAEKVFEVTWDWIKDDENSLAMQMLRRTPVLPPVLNGAEPIFCESNRQALLYLLPHNQADDPGEPWPADVHEAYTSTISYIGSILIAIAGQEEPSDICRRVAGFPVLIQKRFIDLVNEMQPRALVVLAHYFAILARFRDVWWVGGSGEREVLGIRSVLPDEWQHLMAWPLKTMEEASFRLPTMATPTVVS